MPMEKRDTGQRELMGRGKKYQPEQVVNLLRQIEVAVTTAVSSPHRQWICGFTEIV